MTYQKIKTTLCILLLVPVMGFTQSAQPKLDKEVKLKPGKYKPEFLIEKINATNAVNITYNNETFTVNEIVVITKENPTVKQLLDEIQKSLPVEYTTKGDYIIMKRKLAKKKIHVTGEIIDSITKEPLIGANILLKEKNKIVANDAKGNFTFELDPGENTLVISYVGYKTEMIKLSNEDTINLKIFLKQSSNLMGEVKVTSKLRKFYDLDVGRPLETISAKQIENAHISNASDILNGRLSGVWATQTSGLPGDHQRVRIRGISSLFGSVDPLFVVDGVSVPMVNLNTLGIADLNTHDIDNITILKDASSNALFGYQGGNGVVLIDTKRGKRKSEIIFSTKFGLQWSSARYDLMNTKDFLTSLDSAKSKLKVDNRQYYPVYDTIAKKFVYNDTLSSVNWQDKIFKIGVVKEYQLSGSGVYKDVSYYLSGNYFNNLGIIDNTSYKRYTIAANAEKTFFDRLTLEVGYRGSLQQNRNNVDGYGGNKIIFEGINKSPCLLSTPDSLYYLAPAKDKRTAYRIYQPYDALNSRVTPDSILANTKKQLDIAMHTYRASLNYRIMRDLNFKISSSLSKHDYHYLTEINKTYVTAGGLNYVNSYEHVLVIDNQCNLKWQQKLGGHEFKILAGAKAYTDNVYWNDSVPLQEIDFMNYKNDEAFIRNSMAIHGPSGAVVRRIRSLLGNFNYNYNSKYFISLAGNYESMVEGNYVVAATFFPSVSVNYDLAHEYLINKLTWLNHLNIYTNWGRAGNYPLNGLSNDIYQNVKVMRGTTLSKGQYIYQLANRGLKQEIVEERDYGFTIDLFANSRICISGDKYNKVNNNLIMLRDIPGYYGTGKMYYNVGEIETHGKEATIEITPVLTSKFTWYSKFNISVFNQTVNKLDKDSFIKIANTTDIMVPEFEIKVKEPLGVIYAYKYMGKWTSADTEKKDKRFIQNRGFKYEITDTSKHVMTKVPIGSSLPKLTWNWYHSFTYKDFGVEMLWYAVVGVKKYNATRAASYMAGTNREINAFINDSAKSIFHAGIARQYPDVYLDPSTDSYFYQSSYFVEDASFVKLKQLTFSYEPTKKLYDKIEMKFSIILENVLTLTKYKGYDPEVSIYTDNNFSDNAIDRGAFPNPKAFYISVTFKF